MIFFFRGNFIFQQGSSFIRYRLKSFLRISKSIIFFRKFVGIDVLFFVFTERLGGFFFFCCWCYCVKKKKSYLDVYIVFQGEVNVSDYNIENYYLLRVFNVLSGVLGILRVLIY